MTRSPADRLLVLPLATGFGAGFVPRFPGTAGTAVGALAYWGLSAQPAAVYAAACAAAAALGVWLCGRAARVLGEADPPAVVWDEIAGYWVAMSLAPRGLGWALAGFVLFRYLDNQPAGFDVDYCLDLAGSLGVEAEIVETPWADRIPSLISNRADVSIAAASDTLERAQTVGFSIPYMIYVYQVAVQEGSDIEVFDDLKGRTVGTVVSTTNEEFFVETFNEWNDPKGEHVSLQTEADMFLALSQGKVDAIISGNTAVANIVKSGKYANVAMGPEAPFPVDVTGIMTRREEYGLLRYLDLFVNRQVRSGRYQSLGMSMAQTYRYILVPQVLRAVYYPITNQMIWAILTTSLGMVVGLKELAGVTQSEQGRTFRTFEFFAVAAVIYYAIAKIVMAGSRLVAWRLFRS